eukprot:CAMPEP_0182425546 /NCGR_PEP_ID=MMETSP1167-20130531/11992_1 /TAXON_ID=2988 /ORGANISM="Mallomonas Sp, Strain CCMP3275" /LENGTH=1275 /DNA_ID=CAMNT_0024606357 /DNA_START=182 /DNA_END=4006 /DNA_ORIENTATION=+
MEDAGVLENSQSTQMFNLDKRLVDLDEDARDLLTFCQVLHSHLPDSTKNNGVMSGYTNPENRTAETNFKRIQSALELYRLEFEFELEDLMHSARSMLMMLLHMFLNIPALIPKTTIEFKGILGAPIVKTVELKNPSNRRVSYRITIEGSEDFSIGYDSIVIDPQSEVDFEITCNARFSTPASGRVTFWGVRDRGSGPSTMVFKITSNIVDRKPIETSRCSVALFELETLQISVTNPFDVACTYPITLQHSSVRTSIQDVLRNRQIKQSALKKKTALDTLDHTLLSSITATAVDYKTDDQKEEEEEIKRIIEQPIWCAEQSIYLMPRGTGTITVYVLPFVMGLYTAQIIMMEENSGEFCYQVEAEVGLPRVTERLDFTVPQVGGGTSVQRALRIIPRNSPFESAAGTASEMRLHVSKRIRARSLLQQFLSYPIQGDDDPTSTFGIDIQSPYFNTHKEFTCISDYANSGRPAGTGTTKADMKKTVKVIRNTIEELPVSESGPPPIPNNTAVFSFFPERPGLYKSRVIVFCSQNEFDFRVFEILANVTTPMRASTLEFKGAAKQTMSQDIPIVNDSGKDWQLQTTVTGREFSGAKYLPLKKGDKANYTVCFLAQYAGKFEGNLSFREANSGDTFQYKLIGEAEEPLAEGHLVFKATARSKETLKIPLQQLEVPARGASRVYQTLSVETDLAYISGPSTIDVHAHGGEYVFTVLSPVGGIMTGYITFTDVATGVLVWYTVEIEVTSPKAESTIVVEAMVRRAVAVEISLDNPTSEEQELHVEIEGEGLIGDNIFSLPPGSAGQPYELIFSPLIAGTFRGRIAFTNDKVGEFWYSVQLKAIPAPPTQLDCIECMLGDSRSIAVPVENPLNEGVSLSVRISDSEHFSVYPEGQVFLEPYSQTTFDLVFTPSSLTEVAYSIITFSHPLFGELMFSASGKGQLPGVMPGVNLFAALDEIGSHTIVFRNPFHHALPLDVYINEETNHFSQSLPTTPNRSPMATDRTDLEEVRSCFALLLRKSTGLVLAPHSTLQVGVSFSPKKLGQYNAVVQVRASVAGRALLWCFPVTGVAEAGTPQVLPKLVTKCKTSLVRDVVIPLQGLKESSLAPGEELSLSHFSLELVVDPQQKTLVSRAFRMQPLSLIQLTNDPSADFAISYRVLLEPLRVFQTVVQIMIMSSDKGRWRAEIDLQATDPEPDDVIQLTAAVGGQDKVAFRLSNRFLGYSSFQAYFSVHSSTHFSVSPTAGVLAPFGTDGTQFIVAFAPLEYGGREKALLNIVTDDAQW